MNRSIFKQWLSLLIAVLTVLPVLLPGNLVSFADEEVYLTDLAYESVTTISGELSIDNNITIGTESYEKGVYIHPLGAGDENAASIVYDIGGGAYKSFSVWVGKNSAGGTYNNLPMRFEVHIDGKPVAISDTLQHPDKEKLEVTIPSGASKLTLVAKAVGSAHYACGAGFGDPVLVRRSADDVEPTIEIGLTELNYSGIQSLFDATDPYTTTTEGEPRIDNAIQIGTCPYEKGIYLHPVSAGGSAYITYDVTGLGYTTFRTYVGKDVNGADWGNNQVQFEVYVNGVLFASSRALQYPSLEELTVTLPADAKELKLVAKALSSHSATGCCFGDPVLSKKDGTTPVTAFGKSLTDLEYSDLQCLFEATDPKTTTTEGEPRIDNAIQIGTYSYEKGIYLHPVSAGGSAYITYDITGLSYQTFRTYVGKDANGSGYGNNPVQFEIYVDEVLAASSSSLQYPAVELLSVTLPEGAQTLKLVAKALSDHRATGCCFGNPVLEHTHVYGEWQIDSGATFTSDGCKRRTCPGCGDEETETIAAASLGVLDAVIVNEKDGKNAATVVGTIACESLDRAAADALSYTLVFARAGEVVKTVEGNTKRIYATVTGVASVNKATAEAQVVRYVENANYLLAVSVLGIPAGDYTVRVTVNAVQGGAVVASCSSAEFAFTVA